MSKTNPTPMDSYMDTINKNWEELSRIDNAQKEKGELVYRVIRHPYADGYAVYQIIKVNKRTVRIEVVTGLGDDWVLPAWGTQASIPRATAENLIGRQDAMAALFARKETK